MWAILSYQAPQANSGRKAAQGPDLMKSLHHEQNAVWPRPPLSLPLGSHGAAMGTLGVCSVAVPAVL